MAILNSELKELLEQLTTPMRAGLLGEVADFLTGLGVSKHELVIESVFARLDNENTSQSLMDIESGLLVSLDSILREHGVLMSANDIESSFAVVETLYGIPTYGDPTELYDIVNDDAQTPESMLSELVSMFTSKTAEEIVDTIGEVKDALIGRIGDVVREMMLSTDTASDWVQTNHSRNRYRMRFPDDALTMAKTLIRDGLQISLAADIYLDTCEKAIKELPPEQMAKEVAAICLLSDTPDDELVSTADELLTSLIGNPDVLSSTKVAVSHYLT